MANHIGSIGQNYIALIGEFDPRNDAEALHAELDRVPSDAQRARFCDDWAIDMALVA